MPAKSVNGDKPSALVLRFRATNTPAGLTRETWKLVAKEHGLSETEAIHRAMVMFASKTGAIMKKLPQEQLPVDLSGYQLDEFTSFLKKNSPDWVASAGDGQRTKA